MEPPAPTAYERTDSLPDNKVGVVRARAVACERTDSFPLYSSKQEQDKKSHSDWEVVQATVVSSERRNEAAASSSSIIKQQDERSPSEWDALKSDARGLPVVVKATARSTLVPSPRKMAWPPKGALPSALRKPTIVARADARIKSEDTCTTYPESRNGDSDEDEEDCSKVHSLVTPGQTSPSFLEAKSHARVNGVSFGNVEVREHSLNEGLSVIDTVDGYEAKRSQAKQLPRVPKDAPTKKSQTYETIRVLGATTTTPRPTQVAHHEPPPPPSSQQDFLYSDFEAKFQSKRNKSGGKIGFFFGLFKRKSSKKNNSLAHI